MDGQSTITVLQDSEKSPGDITTPILISCLEIALPKSMVQRATI